jgi:hypothetical protein
LINKRPHPKSLTKSREKTTKKTTIMKKQILIATLSALILIGAGCKKTKLTGPYEVYEGTWKSMNKTLVLKSNGKADYTSNPSNGSNVKVTNGRLIITDSKLTIKAIKKFEFNITMKPAQDTAFGNEWTMILDNELYFKY